MSKLTPIEISAHKGALEVTSNYALEEGVTDLLNIRYDGSRRLRKARLQLASKITPRPATEDVAIRGFDQTVTLDADSFLSDRYAENSYKVVSGGSLSVDPAQTENLNPELINMNDDGSYTWAVPLDVSADDDITLTIEDGDWPQEDVVTREFDAIEVNDYNRSETMTYMQDSALGVPNERELQKAQLSGYTFVQPFASLGFSTWSLKEG